MHGPLNVTFLSTHQSSVNTIDFPVSRLKDLTFILPKRVFQFWHIVMKNMSVILTAKDKIMK